MAIVEKTVVLPAIYSLTFAQPIIHLTDREGCGVKRDVSKWGWHRATELLVAVQHKLRANGNAAMNPIEIAESFPGVSPYHEYRMMLIVHPDGRESLLGTGPHEWLDAVVKHDAFIPAKIGTALLKAVGRPQWVNRILP